METSKQTLTDLVNENYSYAYVLDMFGIPFYEHLDNTLMQVCRKKGLKIIPILKSLESVDVVYKDTKNDMHDWPADMIIEYLRHSHSTFIKNKLPYYTRLVKHLNINDFSLAKDLQILVPLFAEDFIHHIHEEEDSLFIYILQMIKAKEGRFPLNKIYLEMEKLSINKFSSEHETHDDEMQGIRELTQNYLLPENADIICKVVYSELEAFEIDLQKHAFIENEILFPKAQIIENDLKKKISNIILLN